MNMLMRMKMVKMNRMKLQKKLKATGYKLEIMVLVVNDELHDNYKKQIRLQINKI